METESTESSLVEEIDYECLCENEKKFRLKFDGGDTGIYYVEYCQDCYDHDNKLHLVTEEKISGVRS